MPIPYMGSKRDIAGLIYQTIKNLNPNADTLVDLFCGGFAVGEYFLKNGWRVIANDKNKYVIALLKKIIFEGLDEKKVLEFVTREKFYDVLNNPDKYDEWYVGYVMNIWSFGNFQKNYLFGKDVEPYKKAGHELVVNKNSLLIQKLIPHIPQKYIDGLLQLDTWHKRRLALNRISHKLKTRILELQHLERLQHLEHRERLEFYSKDYKEVFIPDGVIVYCDPPYQDTAEYKVNDFNHKEFWDWVRKKSKKYKIYISEYSAPMDFKLVLEVPRIVKLQGGANKNQPTEKLFTYGG